MSEANASGHGDKQVPTINLISHVADEYGMAPGTARDLVRYGTVKIGEDENSLKDFDGNVELVPLEFLEGKTVRVVHEIRTVQFVYRTPLSQRLG